MEKNLLDVLLTEFNRLYKENPNTTIWDAFLSSFKKYEEPYLLTLKADLPLIEKIISGFSAASIANVFAIPSKDVYEVANIWGLEVLDFTLDFNPLQIFERGTPAYEFMLELNEFLPIPVSLYTAKQIVSNLERYYTLLDFLDKEDDKIRKKRRGR